MKKTPRILLAALAASSVTPAGAAITFAGNVAVSGSANDRSGLAPGPATTRLSFGSDLHFDRSSGFFYGISDRGPGGGVYDYAPRVHRFTLSVDATNAAISNFQLVDSIVFKGPGGAPLTGLTPSLIPGGSAGVLGAAFDSEGFVLRGNGNFLVSDEYGPSIYEFAPDGSFVRAFDQPANLLPRNAGGAIDYSNSAVTGRQDNRGYEGLTLSPDGKTAYAILQDPLASEGDQNDGRRSRNLRIVAFDVASGKPAGQYIYQLEDRADINARLPSGAATFGAMAQGRNIGVSSITALGDGKFLVIERDNRGWGVDNATATGAPVGSKRIYLIDINGATDVSNIGLAGANALPAGVKAVSKALFIDIQAALTLAGLPVPEKIEGLTFGPQLANGGYSLILATDNDFSVTQNGQNVQFDVCTSGTGAGATMMQVAFGGACPAGMTLIPSNLYSFAVTGREAAMLIVPEAPTWGMMIVGFGLAGLALRRYNRAFAQPRPR